MKTRKDDISARIEEEHKQLRACMESLVEELEKDIDPARFKEWKLDFLLRLRDFQNNLQKHFDLEEEGGYMADIMQVAPQYAFRLENLREEHRKIITDLNHIVSVLKGIDHPSPSGIERLRRRVHDLLELFRQHESEEYRLIQEAYMQDYGQGD